MAMSCALLLGHLQLPTVQEEQACWDELGALLDVCGTLALAEEFRAPGPASADAVPGSASIGSRRALARKAFTAALAEWVNM